MRIFLLSILIILAGKISFSQGTNCYGADPFCTGTTYQFQNNVGVSSAAGPDYGCLLTQPNQAWYYLKIGTNGSIDIGIQQTTGINGTGSLIDVDFICYGPFTSATGGCGNLTAGNTIDCSYSTAGTETCNIPSGVAGQYYVLLLTNFSNTAGYIQFSQVGGTGATDCSILCPLGSSGITPVAALSCTSAAVAVYADESTLPTSQAVTPCLMFQVPLTDNSGKNILEVYENGSLLGCFKPAVSSSTCSPNAGTIPNGNKWEVYASFLDPTLPHTFRMCEDNSASTSGNMSFKIFDCYKTSGSPIASGTWTVNTGAAYPGSCQAITINPGAGAGQWNFTGSSFFSGPGISTTNWGGALFNPATAGPGTHTITYNWNNGVVGAGACVGTKTMAVTVSNPFNAAFTTPGPFCASAACVTLTPTNTYTLGTNSWSGTGVSGNTFCPTTSGVGSFPVTYSVGTSATCRSTVTNSIVVNSIPTANAGSTASLTCSNSTATLSGSGGGTYAWSGTGITSGATSANPTVNQAGTYTLVVTSSGCPSLPATVSVTQNTTAPTPSASNSNSLNCSTTSAVLTGSGGGTYNWSGPGIVSGGTTANPTVNLGGTYVLTVTAANGCTATANTSVTQNTTTPSATASNSSTLNCSVTSANLTGSGGGTYAWSGPGITAGGTTSAPTVNLPGTYVLTVTAANGCTATANTSITQNTTAPSPTASNSSTLTCSVTSANLTGTGGGTYAWSGPGITAGGTTSAPTVNLPGTYVLTVTATNGCTATANTSITQNTTAPSPTASNSSTLTCSTKTIGLTGTGGGIYAWSGPGITSGAATSSPSVNLPGTYVLTVTAANGCTATANTSVTQNTTIPSPTASNSSTLTCSITSANLTGTGGGSYSWSGPGITAGGTTSAPTVNLPGTYVLTVTAVNGCTATANTAITQNTSTPSVTGAVSGAINCTLTSVNVSASTIASPVTYNWTGSGITSAANISTITVNQPGTYNYTVTNTSNGCFATGSQIVTQNTTAVVATAGSNQTLVCGVSSVTLTGSGSAGSSANWLGGVCGSATNFTTTACAPGTYTLVATNPLSGCSSTSTVSVGSSTNVPQATVNAITNSITCTNSVVTIGVTLSNSDPVTYAWAGPGISGTSNTSVTTATLSGNYNVTITNTVSGCQSVYGTTVPTNTTPVSATTSSNGTITCTTNTITLLATPTSGTNYSYSWSGPGTILNGLTNNPTVDAGGNYVVTITDNTNGCSNNFTATAVTSTTAPTFTLGSASSLTTTCASPNATLSASSSLDPNTIYTWTTPSLTTLTGSPVFVSATGVYTVVVTNTINGCSTSSASAQSTVEVIADSGIPVVTLSSNSLSITCSNPTPSVAITTTASPVSYNWTPTSGIVPGTETTANPVFNAAGSYSVVVTNTVSSCATSVNANIVNVTLDNIPPVISLSASASDGTITCTNTQVTITPTVTTSGSSNLTYTWSPSGVTSTSINDATFTSAGIYTLAVTNTLTGCVSTSTNTANTFTVYQNTVIPSATITAISTNSTIGCGGNSSTVTLNGVSSSTSTVQTWLPGSITTPTLGVTSAGVYTLVVVDAVSGCSVSTQYAVNGSTTTPQNVDAGTNASIPCGNPSLVLNGTTTSTDVVTYNWSGPNATSISGPSNVQNPTVIDAGIYTLTVTNTSNGCSATATVNVSQSNVTAGFTADPMTGISPLSVNFTNTSIGAINYNWDFNDGNTSSSFNPSNIFTTNGSYTVTLIATAGPCSDTASIIITVNDGLTLEIPNVFTPNNDGSNDVFTIKSTGIKDISLQIFNRWGQKLYEFSGPKASWDGLNTTGSKVPEGTYFYFVKAIGFDDSEINKNGTVNLFR